MLAITMMTKLACMASIMLPSPPEIELGHAFEATDLDRQTRKLSADRLERELGHVDEAGRRRGRGRAWVLASFRARARDTIIQRNEAADAGGDNAFDFTQFLADALKARRFTRRVNGRYSTENILDHSHFHFSIVRG